MVKRNFTKSELLQLITANVFSLLNYDSEIWQIPNLKNDLKKKLTSVSKTANKYCMFYHDRTISHVNIHKMNNSSMPESLMSYKMTLQLHKLYNTNDQSLDWISLNFDQILTSRQTTFMISKTNKTKIGLNTMANRLSILNGRIPFHG